MSTLATNKLGTLSGSADMSLPTTRPSSTSQGFLDANGNLTFGQSTVENVPIFVTDDDQKVCKVLVDQVSSGPNSNAPQSTTVTNTSNVGYWGYSVGVHNAPEALKQNYLFNGNIRTMEIDFSFYVNTDTYGSISSNMYYVPLSTSGARLWQTEQQTMNHSYMEENPDSGGSANPGGGTSTAQASNSGGTEYNYARQGNYSGTIKSGRVQWNCAVTSFYASFYDGVNLRFRRTNGTNDSYPCKEATSLLYSTSGNSNTGRTQSSGSSSKGYGAPWDTQGGCLFTGYNTATTPAMNYFTATCYAIIKPTDLVAT